MDLYIVLVVLFPLWNCVVCEDTAADDIGPHMVIRIAELLSPEECQDFISRINRPEDDLVKKVSNLSPKRRRRREIVTKEQCLATLQKWFDEKGESVYWDRISTILYQVGRPDVSKELGRNLNQDKILEIEKNADEYKQKMLDSSLLLPNEEFSEIDARQRDVFNFEDMDWDLIIERKPRPPYQRALTEWCWYMLYGVIIGFLGGAVMVVMIYLLLFRVLKIDGRERDFYKIV
ncbi:transmembrane and death domain protein 1-like [Pelobates fuscus]|uniref:transmembrane and death domain protein 1-like n=1 Tax=Pelobates fuscus TaxID=191477 RepID=UPI002FE4BD14